MAIPYRSLETEYSSVFRDFFHCEVRERPRLKLPTKQFLKVKLVVCKSIASCGNEYSQSCRIFIPHIDCWNP